MPANENTTRPLGLAIVGTGMVASVHAAAIGELSGLVEVVGCYSRDPARRAAFGKKHGFRPFDDLAALIGSPDVNAVLVLTPPNARQDVVSLACAAGKHILMEKPVERDVEAARTIVGQCDRTGLVLGVVLQHRFRPAAMELRALIESGALGRICAVRVSVPWWRPQSYYDEPGRGTYARDGGGVLINQAIHSLDLAVWLGGLPETVQAVTGTTPLHDMEAEDFVGAGFGYANGAVGALMATTAAYPGGNEQIVLDCERGSAVLEGSLLTVRYRDGREERFGQDLTTGGGADPMAFPHDWHKALIADFAHAVSEGRPPAVSGEEALKVHRLIAAIALSGRTGTAQPV